ncbi:MAG TPA: adenosine deaminase, partial [Haliangium sp.]|nr:adenosine deaminase [Haliangium sp.]
ASWDAHPVDFFVDYGLRVTINTDNRLITDTTVSKELWLCHLHYGWSLETIKEVLVAGFKSAFISYREKADLLKVITAELDAIQSPKGEQGNVTAAPVIYELREAREARDAKTPGSIVEAAPQAREGAEISH